MFVAVTTPSVKVRQGKELLGKLQDLNLLWDKRLVGLGQGYSNGGPRSESGPLDGDGRASSASQRCILHPEFLSQNFALLAVLLKHLLLANCVIVDQAVVQLNCSAHLSWASYDFLFQSNCFVIIVQQ